MKRSLVGLSRGSLLTVGIAFWSIAGAGDRPTIAVIGTGDMGDSLGPRFAALGYPVVYGSREPSSAKVRELVRRSGRGASAAGTERISRESKQSVLILFPRKAFQ